LALLAVVTAAAIAAGGLWWYSHPRSERVGRIVYTQRRGHNLTFDFIRPARPNGLGIAVMVSGGWRSGPDSFRPWMVAPLLRRGYTIFAVSHLSQPQATVMEIVETLIGAWLVRSRQYDIDPNRTASRQCGGFEPDVGDFGPVRLMPAIPWTRALYRRRPCSSVTDLLHLDHSTENPGDGGPPSFVAPCRRRQT
jgi:hypothetical protein